MEHSSLDFIVGLYTIQIKKKFSISIAEKVILIPALAKWRRKSRRAPHGLLHKLASWLSMNEKLCNENANNCLLEYVHTFCCSHC